jgi:hypothetical protein
MTKADDIDYLRCHPDFTSTLAWKVTFAFILVGFVVFFILYISEVIKGTDDCLEGTQLFLSCSQPTKYTISWTFRWDKNINGPLTPDNAHFSVPIGAVYPTGTAPFWAPGKVASPGMKHLAELGNNTLLKNEIKSNHQEYFETGTTSTIGISEISTTFSVNSNYRFLTIASMVKPSPDWFVGASAVDLCDSGGNWHNYLAIPLIAYSAGTDSGTAFNSPNIPITLPIPISQIQGDDLRKLFNDYPLGAVSLTRVPS